MDWRGGRDRSGRLEGDVGNSCFTLKAGGGHRYWCEQPEVNRQIELVWVQDWLLKCKLQIQDCALHHLAILPACLPWPTPLARSTKIPTRDRVRKMDVLVTLVFSKQKPPAKS